MTHLDEGQKIYRAIGDCAPAFGNGRHADRHGADVCQHDDPSKLGPYMAVALLATFYGAAVSILFCLPIADKLMGKLHDEELNRTLILDGVMMIRDAKSPTLVARVCWPICRKKHRHMEEEEDDEAAEPAAGLTRALTGIGFGHGKKEKSRGSRRRRSRLVRHLRRVDGTSCRVFS